MVGSVNIPARLVVCNYGHILRKALATKYSFVESTLNGCVRRNWERSHPPTHCSTCRHTGYREENVRASFGDAPSLRIVGPAPSVFE
jgi:hypothetical protein